MKRIFLTRIIILLLIPATSSLALEWNQFRGPKRNGKSEETDLLKQWPEGGPKELWCYEKLAKGYASVAVVGGFVYTTGMADEKG